MSTRTVTVYFYNNTTNSLTLSSSSTEGSWITPPPTSIPAVLSAINSGTMVNAEVAAQSTTINSVEQITPKTWKGTSAGTPANASGTVTYQLDGTSLYLTLNWHSVEGQRNNYTYTAPTGYSVGVSGSGDVDATVTYTFSASS